MDRLPIGPQVANLPHNRGMLVFGKLGIRFHFADFEHLSIL
jgi:hypothetical protein